MAPQRLAFPLVPVRRTAGVAFGSMRSRRRGIGSETASIREYQPGDDIRRIDWNASARLSAALGRDEFLVREYHAEQARSVLLAVDRSASMGLYPADSPWLCKPRAVAACASLIVASARAEACPFSYLDENGIACSERYGRPGAVSTFAERIRYDRPEGALDTVLEQLVTRRIPSGSFVFLLSDFLADPLPEPSLWQRTLARGIELVPVVIQEPLLERSFPALKGVLVPVVEPGSGRPTSVRLSRREACELRQRNEQRLASLHDLFGRLGLDWVEAESSDTAVLHSSFLGWAESRRRRAAA